MRGFTFLDPNRPDADNMTLIGISRAAIVSSAVREKLLVDDDLATVPEPAPPLMKMAGELRDDLFEHHHAIGKQIQMPLVQNCCAYAFAKGAEAAYLWHKNEQGRVTLSYSKDDALEGRAGAQVPTHLALAITGGMQKAGDVFCDFQNSVLLDETLGFNAGGRWLADAFASAFFWFSQVGLDFGMSRLGYQRQLIDPVTSQRPTRCGCRTDPSRPYDPDRVFKNGQNTTEWRSSHPFNLP